VLHSFGGVVGECLCAFAFTEIKQFGYSYDGITLTLNVYGASDPTSVGSITGNLINVDWSITEWQLGVITNLFSGTLLAGGFHQEILPAADATYVMMATLKFDDEVSVVIRNIVETRIIGAAFCQAWIGKGAYLTSLDCNLIDMNAGSAGATCGRIFNPRWLDSSLGIMGLGLSYNGLISEGTQFDFVFVGALDAGEWLDLGVNEIYTLYSMKGAWCQQ
jgi:hypothetical protein